MVQSTVRAALGIGSIGTLYLDGPSRAQPGIIDSVGPNTVGYAFTQVAGADGHCIVGGTITAGTPFYGILANPKVYALRGTTAGGPLAASLDLPQYTPGEFVTMGELLVSLPAACQVGDLVDYTVATGAITTHAPGGAAAGGDVNIPNAVISRFNLTGAGIGVVKLTN